MTRAGRSPEDWVGQQVVVEIMPEPDRQEVARLDGIDYWGVTLGYGEDHPLKEEDREAVVFMPWRHIFAVWLASKNDFPPATG